MVDYTDRTDFKEPPRAPAIQWLHDNVTMVGVGAAVVTAATAVLALYPMFSGSAPTIDNPVNIHDNRIGQVFVGNNINIDNSQSIGNTDPQPHTIQSPFETTDGLPSSLNDELGAKAIVDNAEQHPMATSQVEESKEAVVSGSNTGITIVTSTPQADEDDEQTEAPQGESTSNQNHSQTAIAAGSETLPRLVLQVWSLNNDGTGTFRGSTVDENTPPFTYGSHEALVPKWSNYVIQKLVWNGFMKIESAGVYDFKMDVFRNFDVAKMTDAPFYCTLQLAINGESVITQKVKTSDRSGHKYHEIISGRPSVFSVSGFYAFQFTVACDALKPKYREKFKPYYSNLLFEISYLSPDDSQAQYLPIGYTQLSHIKSQEE